MCPCPSCNSDIGDTWGRLTWNPLALLGGTSERAKVGSGKERTGSQRLTFLLFILFLLFIFFYYFAVLFIMLFVFFVRLCLDGAPIAREHCPYPIELQG